MSNSVVYLVSRLTERSFADYSTALVAVGVMVIPSPSSVVHARKYV